MSLLPGQRELLTALRDDPSYRVFPAKRYVEKVFPGAHEATGQATLEEIIGPLEIAESEEYWFHLAGRSRKSLLTNRQVLKSIDTWIARALDPQSLPRFPKYGDAEFEGKRAGFERFYGETSTLGYARLVAQLKATEMLGQTECFVSLNYDLLLDRAITAAGLSIDYSVDGFAELPTTEPSDIHVIKLHGSLNWRMCDSCHYLRNLRNASIWPGSKCQDCRSAEARPMLIRPTFLKDFRHRVWQGLWREAGHCLAAADHWFLVGYSLPLADVWVLRMLAQSARSRAGGMPTVTVVNPDDGADRRFRLLFPDAIHERASFDEWLDGRPFDG